MTPNQRVVATAARYIGVRENPMGSNQGTLINKWGAHWGYPNGGVPWCGIFASAVLREAGVTDVSNPGTALICQQGKANGWTTNKPVPGALIVWCGTHVGILVDELSPGVWATIEGNHGDQVARGVRSLAGATLVVSPELRDGGHDKPQPSYWIEDTLAQPRLIGPWRTKASRDKAVEKLPLSVRATARKVRTAKGRYAALLGPRRLYGPWPTKDARDTALKVLERRIGHTLRPFSKNAANKAVAAQALGKTT